MKTNFDKVVLIKDDAGKWNICMIAEGQLRSCLIAAEDAKEYFATDEQHQTNIAMCYWWAIERGFIEQTDLFLGHINDEQKKKIERVNIFTNKEGKKMILVTIKDLGKQPPREISDIMWQRMWIYPDMAEFKIRLACEYYKDSLLTPPSSLLTQYNELKRKHPDALLLFRTNDFYETYKEDAEKAAKALGITLTRSSQTKDEDGKPLAMAGFPHFALDTYLPKLIRAGHRVAICDRIEQPKR